MALKRQSGLHENFELNDDVLFSSGAGFSSGQLLSFSKRENHLEGLPKEEPQIPSATLQQGSTLTQMPTTQKNPANSTGELVLIWKVTVWLRTASRNPTIFRKLIIYKRKTLRKQSFELPCVSALKSKQGMMPYFPLAGTCFRGWLLKSCQPAVLLRNDAEALTQERR